MRNTFAFAMFGATLLAATASAQASTKSVRVLYVVPSDAQRSDRAALVANAVEHNRQTWHNYGATMTTDDVVTVRSHHDVSWFLTNPNGYHGALAEWYWFGNACNAARDVYPDACTWDANHKYIIFLEADISSVNSNGAAANFGAAVMPKWIIDGAEQGDLHRIGSIGHELGHTFGMPHSDCPSLWPTKNIMCNGDYYPHNRLNHLDYPYLFSAASSAYFEETPSDLFDVGQGKVLAGEIWKTQLGLDLEGCALSCLSDPACSSFVHFDTTCEFKGGRLSEAWDVPGYTSAQIKIPADGAVEKKVAPISPPDHATQVCRQVCDIWRNVPWTESSWTGTWWTPPENEYSVCLCDYNPDYNP
ncbi:hypothetical protein [Sorangium sp. So ce388]|uniref:hypothetical protein n=1 Tax=Sorangium sp. So ce388 TaxID=3133309 RepID=UPI003F5C5405